MITEMHADDFPLIYAQLVTRFPKKPWLKRIQNLQHEIKAKPISIPALVAENRIAYGLTWFDAGVKANDIESWEAVKAAMAFAIQVNSMCDAETQAGSSRLAGRVAGAFNNPADLRAMTLELHAAIGLHRKGLTVQWPETIPNSVDTFDILASGANHDVFEVECKSFSSDKGLKIPAKEAQGFLGELLTSLSPTLSRGAMVAVSISVPKRLPTGTTELKGLRDKICAAIHNNAPVVEELFSLEKLSIEPFAPGEIKGQAHLAELFSKHVRDHVGEMNSMRLIATTPNLACVLLTIASDEGDGTLKAWEDSAKNAIRKQMSGKRPGCLIIRLEGMSGHKMKTVCQVHPNLLSVFSEALMTNVSHKHLACIVFISDSDWVDTDQAPQLGQSCTYVFNNPGGNYPNLGLGSYFME
ncbi:hypothetical protein [Pseudomonas sp. K2I15]|uniref:hypothetical protein n=1 Tax=Pseudomonas sp. K2I15 TaxID=2013577 RepID=UPI000B4C3EA6|nr:hypothetical protein [Pseudomonas sp. K2I15]OWP72949.1 hypothetical protein CEC48_04530 [Pseudomonas sp. K2I15]